MRKEFFLIEFIKNPKCKKVSPTKEQCLITVTTNGLALKFIEEQSEEICLIAVKQNGLALEFVKIQTEAICLAAVKQNGLALEFVEHQTYAICLAAVKQNGAAKKYIKELQESNEDKCPCCFELCSTKTVCNHQLCRACFDSLDTKTCPLCRSTLVFNFQRVYLFIGEDIDPDAFFNGMEYDVNT